MNRRTARGIVVTEQPPRAPSRASGHQRSHITDVVGHCRLSWERAPRADQDTAGQDVASIPREATSRRTWGGPPRLPVAYDTEVRRLTVALVLTVFALASTRVHAGELAWDAPAGECPDADGFAALVAEMSHGQVIDVAVRAHAWRGDDGWHVRVAASVDGQSFARELEAPTCAEVARAASLIVALLGRDTARATTEAAVPTEPTAPQVLRTSKLPVQRAAWLDVRIEGGAGLGTLPGVAPSVAFAIGVRGGALWRVEVGGESRFAASRTNDDGSGADFDLLAADLSACLTPGAWRGCAGIALGRLVGRGFGSSEDFADRSLWSALTVGLGHQWKLSSWLGILAAARLGLPTRRAVFKVEGVELHAVAPLDASVSLGVVLKIF